MSLLKSFFQKKPTEMSISAPTCGTCMPINQVNDSTFADELLGKGIAILPSSGKIFAPADGTITTIFPTGHAVVVTTKEGAEILIHIGLDTVKLNGNGFTSHVSEGDNVKKGDLLIDADLKTIEENGFDTVVIIVICNTSDYAAVTPVSFSEVTTQDDILSITLA